MNLKLFNSFLNFNYIINYEMPHIFNYLINALMSI